MSEFKIYLFYQFNKLYHNFPPLYRLLYFLYKKISDRDKIRIINKHVKKGMKVLDIGANIGFYTMLLARLVGEEGIVYAFEPDKVNFNFLKRLTTNLCNVKVVNAACGIKSGITYLYLSKKMNIDHQVYKSSEYRERIEVEMISVDDYFKSDIIDFIKIDVQGYDYFVFKGMKKTIALSPNIFIIGELWPYGLKRAGSSANEYLSEFKQAGFDIDLIYKGEFIDFSLYDEDKLFYIDFIAQRKKAEILIESVMLKV